MFVNSLICFASIIDIRQHNHDFLINLFAVIAIGLAFLFFLLYLVWFIALISLSEFFDDYAYFAQHYTKCIPWKRKNRSRSAITEEEYKIKFLKSYKLYFFFYSFLIHILESENCHLLQHCILYDNSIVNITI